MNIFRPDDFRGRPYEGGLNQGGHVVAGATLETLVPIVVAVLVILALELWQLWRLGATRTDFRVDKVFWLSGAVGWFYASDSEFSAYAPFAPVLAFSLEYVRLRWVCSGHQGRKGR